MQKTYKILSIDGGGIRGILPVVLLRKLQEELSQPLWKYFDLITGTSTGGIIALALSLEKSLQEVENLYVEKGPLIFDKPNKNDLIKKLGKKRRVIVGDGAQYNSRLLIEELDKQYKIGVGEDTKDALMRDAKTRLCIPSIDITHGLMHIFKTPHIVNVPERKKFVDDSTRAMRDVAAATSAAPTFLNTAKVENSYFVDGGLWANNPSLVGLLEARRCGYEFNEIRLLSLGTGCSVIQRAKEQAERMNLCDWGLTGIVETTLEMQSESSEKMAHFFLEDVHYLRVQYKMTNRIGIDDVGRIPDLKANGDRLYRDYEGRIKKMFLAEVSTNTPYNEEII